MDEISPTFVEVKIGQNLKDFTDVNPPIKYFYEYSVFAWNEIFMPKGSKSPTAIMRLSSTA